jgi:hypothetical protein
MGENVDVIGRRELSRYCGLRINPARELGFLSSAVSNPQNLHVF